MVGSGGLVVSHFNGSHLSFAATAGIVMFDGHYSLLNPNYSSEWGHTAAATAPHPYAMHAVAAR